MRSYVAFHSEIQATSTKGMEFFLKSSRGNREFSLLKVLDLDGVYRPEIDYIFEKLLQLT